MPTRLISSTELGTWIGKTLTGPAESRANLIIETLSGFILSYTGRTWDATNVPGEVRSVLFAAARREFVNPERWTTKEKGPYRGVRGQQTVTLDMFAKSELSTLSRFRKIPGLHTIGSYRSNPYTGEEIDYGVQWVDVDGTDIQVPWQIDPGDGDV